MAAGDHLQRRTTERLELPQQIQHGWARQIVARRMSQHGATARGAYPAHRLRQGHPFVAHIAGLAFDQIMPEYRRDVFRPAAGDDMAREMGTPYQPGIVRVGYRTFQGSGNPRFMQRSGNSVRPFAAPGANLRQPGPQFGMLRIHAQADDMDGGAAPSDRYLHAIEEVHARGSGGLARNGEARDVIVVGQGKKFDAVGMRARRDFGGAQQAIGDMGMAMQIGFKHDGADNSPWKGLKIIAKYGRYSPMRQTSAQVCGTTVSMKFIFDLFPVIVFFIAYKLGDAVPAATHTLLAHLGLPGIPADKPGIYLATLVAIVATLLQVAWVKFKGRKVEPMLWISLAIIVVMGGATLWLHDEAFIKWKPTVLYWVFSGAIFGAAAGGKNLIRSLMNAEVELPGSAWNLLNLSWGVFFALMGVLNLLVAFNFSTDVWVDFKLFGSLGLMLVFVLAQTIFISRHLDKQSD